MHRIAILVAACLHFISSEVRKEQILTPPFPLLPQMCAIMMPQLYMNKYQSKKGPCDSIKTEVPIQSSSSSCFPSRDAKRVNT